MRAIPLLFAVACSDAGKLAAFEDNSTSDTGSRGDEGPGGNDTADEAGDSFLPAWFSYMGTLSVAGGLPTPEGASIAFVLADAALMRLDCEPMIASDLAAAEAPPAGIYAWLTFTVPAATGCEVEAPGLPTRVGIGIGPMDAEVRALLGTVDMDADAEWLWGAYAAADGGEPVAFGYAAAAELEVPSEVPPDGAYTLEPLLLQPLAVPE